MSRKGGSGERALWEEIGRLHARSFIRRRVHSTAGGTLRLVNERRNLLEQAMGTVLIDRTGRFRFDYTDPSQLIVGPAGRPVSGNHPGRRNRDFLRTRMSNFIWKRSMLGETEGLNERSCKEHTLH